MIAEPGQRISLTRFRDHESGSLDGAARSCAGLLDRQAEDLANQAEAGQVVPGSQQRVVRGEAPDLYLGLYDKPK